MFYHLYFQNSVQRNISLQFARVALRPPLPEITFRNAYLNNSEFKIEDFNFRDLFMKISDVD